MIAGGGPGGGPSGGKGFVVRRIVVAVDGSAHGSSAIDVATAIAARLNAEMEAVFVQDINLSRLAELPVGREIHFPTGRGHDFTSTELDAQNREQETSARRATAAAAGRAKIAYSFRVARGQVVAEVMSAAGGADLLILGVASRPLGGRIRAGRVAREAAEHAPRSVLLAKPGARIRGHAMVCYDGSPSAARALEAGARLSGGHDEPLTVLVVADDLDRAAALRAEVDASLAPRHIVPRFLHTATAVPDRMCALATEAGADMLVIGADDPAIEGEARLTLLETIRCPVLLVR